MILTSLQVRVDITGSFSLNGYSVNEISNDTSLTDGSATTLITENAIKTYITDNVTDSATYLRKNFSSHQKYNK